MELESRIFISNILGLCLDLSIKLNIFLYKCNLQSPIVNNVTQIKEREREKNEYMQMFVV